MYSVICFDTHAIIYYIPKVLTFIRRQRQRKIYLFLFGQEKLMYQITNLGGGGGGISICFFFPQSNPNWGRSKFLPDLPKMYGQIRIVLPKVHGRFRIGPPQVSNEICPH